MKSEIQKFWKGDIEDSEEALDKYSHDASLFEVRPELVLFPKDGADIEALVLWVNEHKAEFPELSITPRSAGTCMSGGPLGTSIILDFTRYMNAIKSIQKIAPYVIRPLFVGSHDVQVTGEAVVEPGCYYHDFEPKTLEQELLLPCFTASKSINAVGGMVGNNSGGELTLRYGKTEDYVKEIKVIFADGHTYTVRAMKRKELYQKITEMTFEGQVYKKIFEMLKEHDMEIRAARPQVSKNSAGYNLWNIFRKGETEDEDIFDLTQLFIGSQGTLGIVTEITFRLVDKLPKSKLLVVFMDSTDKLGDLVDELLLTKPISIESYDDKTFKLAIRFFGDFIKTKGFWPTMRFGLTFLPEMWMVLTGGVPKLILLAEYAGNSEEVIDADCKKARLQIKHFGLKMRITKSAREAEKYWTMRRDSFALLRKHVAGKRTAPFIDDIIVRPEFLATFLPEINALVSEYKDLTYTIAGHAANGNFHIIPLVSVDDPELAHTVMELSKRVYDLVLKYHGSITAEHNDGIIRTPFLNQMYGDQICALFAEAKNILDPKNIFNPNKKVGGTKDDIVKYLIKPSRPADHHAS